VPVALVLVRRAEIGPAAAARGQASRVARPASGDSARAPG
jgi:hypothetical protein